jgi:hypothetical protein
MQLLVIVAAILLLAPASGATGHALGRPDLVVASGKQGPRPYDFNDEAGVIEFSDTTTNVGSAPAGPSHTVLFLVPTGGRNRRPIKVLSRSVPALAPGARSHGTRSENFEFSEAPFHTPLLGAYSVRICADADHRTAESNEANNCKKVGLFYFIAQVWVGRSDGRGQFTPTAYESWQSDDIALTFDRYQGNGDFAYTLTAHAQYRDYGTGADGCGTVTGGGIASTADGTADGGGGVTYDQGKEIVGFVGFTGWWGPPNYTPYYIHTICNGDDAAVAGPVFQNFLTTQQVFPFGATHVKGSNTGHLNEVYNFDLHEAALP